MNFRWNISLLEEGAFFFLCHAAYNLNAACLQNELLPRIAIGGLVCVIDDGLRMDLNDYLARVSHSTTTTTRRVRTYYLRPVIFCKEKISINQRTGCDHCTCLFTYSEVTLLSCFLYYFDMLFADLSTCNLSLDLGNSFKGLAVWLQSPCLWCHTHCR